MEQARVSPKNAIRQSNTTGKTGGVDGDRLKGAHEKKMPGL
jgi:hypothetical protein